MDYREHPRPPEKRKWVCEGCGKEFTHEEVGELEWYDGHRCDRPVGQGVLCGGIVLYKKMED